MLKSREQVKAEMKVKLLDLKNSPLLDSEMKLTLVDQPSEMNRPKDHRCLAIFCINLFSVSIVMTSVIFKQIQHAGVTVLDYQFYRIFTILVLSTVVICF